MPVRKTIKNRKARLSQVRRSQARQTQARRTQAKRTQAKRTQAKRGGAPIHAGITHSSPSRYSGYAAAIRQALNNDDDDDAEYEAWEKAEQEKANYARQKLVIEKGDIFRLFPGLSYNNKEKLYPELKKITEFKSAYAIANKQTVRQFIEIYNKYKDIPEISKYLVKETFSKDSLLRDCLKTDFRGFRSDYDHSNGEVKISMSPNSEGLANRIKDLDNILNILNEHNLLTPEYISKKDYDYNNILQYIVDFNWTDEVFDKILNIYSDREFISNSNMWGQTVLHSIAKNGTIHMLNKILSIRSDNDFVNAKSIRGMSAMDFAIYREPINNEIVQKFIDITHIDLEIVLLKLFSKQTADSAYYLANKILTNPSFRINILQNNNANATLLTIFCCNTLKHCSKSGKSEDSILSLILAKNSTPEFLNAQDKFGRTALMYAISNRCHIVSQKLLSLANVERNIKDLNGDTVLHYSISVFRNFYNDNNRSLDLLLKENPHPAFINSQNKDGRTALMVAAGKGNLAAVEKLCKYSARTSIQDNNGNTVLHYASYIKNPDIDLNVVKFLIKENPFLVNIKNKDKKGPGHTDWAATPEIRAIIKATKNSQRSLLNPRGTVLKNTNQNKK